MQQSAGAQPRRQFDRAPVKANAFVHRGSSFQRAQIVDYSQGGLQLEGTFGLVKQDPIQVELVSGVRVMARVAWSLGSHTGIVFPEPLPSSHPAMLELARRARRSRARDSIDPGSHRAA